MKNNILTVAVCMLVAAAAFMIGRNMAQKRYAKQLDEVVSLYTAEDDDSDAVKPITGCMLNPDENYLIDTKGNKVEISALGAPKTVCARYSATGCRPCIETLTEALKKFTADNPDWHVNLLIDNIPLRDIYVLSKDFGPAFTLYKTDGISADTGSDISPVIFRMSPDGMILQHFICDPDNPGRTAAYTQALSYL